MEGTGPMGPLLAARLGLTTVHAHVLKGLFYTPFPFVSWRLCFATHRSQMERSGLRGLLLADDLVNGWKAQALEACCWPLAPLPLQAKAVSAGCLWVKWQPQFMFLGFSGWPGDHPNPALRGQGLRTVPVSTAHLLGVS